tara:strand:+ start:176 stop:1618 length:1443 start_codon:yes stop_codon:yes gene_type:complete
MKQKIILSIFFLIVLSLSVFVSADTCSDTDGLNLYSKGMISGYEDENYGEFEDRCTINPGSDYTVLQEGYCKEDGSSAILTITCSNGCDNGTCIGEQQSVPSCSDSDGGLDFYEKGSISGPKFTGKEEDIVSSKTYEDSCTTKGDMNQLEYYCDSGLIVSVSHWCSQGCSDGACLPEPVCYDSDGLDYYNKGYTQKDDDPKTYDGCKSPHDGTLYERFCRDDGIPYIEDFYCEFGCKDGACLEEPSEENKTCVETDKGKDRYLKGRTYIGKDTHTDSCYQDSLVEYYCSFDLETQKDFIKKDTLKCTQGCEDGACIQLECSETDNGKDGFVKGTTWIGEDTHTDACYNDNVVEYYCSYDSELDKPFIKKDEIICEAGCEDGACLNKTIIKPNLTEGPEEIDNFDKYFCYGCLVEKSCYPLGYRKDRNYCSEENKEFVSQLKAESTCENNFECDSNLCINSECVSGNLWAKFIRWLSRIFG